MLTQGDLCEAAINHADHKTGWVNKSYQCVSPDTKSLQNSTQLTAYTVHVGINGRTVYYADK